MAHSKLGKLVFLAPILRCVRADLSAMARLTALETLAFLHELFPKLLGNRDHFTRGSRTLVPRREWLWALRIAPSLRVATTLRRRGTIAKGDRSWFPFRGGPCGLLPMPMLDRVALLQRALHQSIVTAITKPAPCMTILAIVATLALQRALEATHEMVDQIRFRGTSSLGDEAHVAIKLSHIFLDRAFLPNSLG